MQDRQALFEPGPDESSAMNPMSLIFLSRPGKTPSPQPTLDHAPSSILTTSTAGTSAKLHDQGPIPPAVSDGGLYDEIAEEPPHPTDPLTQSYVEIPSRQAPRNIVFFGETGVGKSTIINMLREKSEERFDDAMASVSNRALGCTLSSTKYLCRMGDELFVFWDTAGLVEGEFGNVTGYQAEENLVDLLRNIEGGGVSLLVYCIRARRFRTVIKHHYDLFYEKTCEKRVPILLVVTGLENEVRMEDWWVANAWEFETRGIEFDAHACITSTRGKPISGGKGYMFDEEYEESSQLLRGHIISRSEPSNVRIPASKDMLWSAQWNLKHVSNFKNWPGVPKRLSKDRKADSIDDNVNQPVYSTAGPTPPRSRLFELGSHYSQGFGDMIPVNPLHHLL